jgi:hypothetical protein
MGLSGARRPRFKAGETLADIGDEAGFPLLAIGDNVDTGLRLSAYHLGYRAPHSCGKSLGVIGLAGFFRFHEGNQVSRTCQTSDEGGENPFGAPLHRLPPSLSTLS